MMDIRTLAHALGGDVAGRDGVLAPGPGHSPKDRSLHITLSPTAPDGFVVKSFASDDDLVCKDYVRSRLGLPAWQPGDGQNRTIHPSRIKAWDRAAVDGEVEDGPRVWTEEEHARIDAARRIFEEAVDPRGSLAEHYLNAHRRLDLPNELCGSVLRFHPRCPWRNEDTGRTDRHPALVVAYRSIDDDRITGVHRIALRPDGNKIGRRMLGVVFRSAMMLDPAGPSLAIGEGLETCLAGRQLGYGPTWALGSVGAISFFPVITGVERLLVYGEAGQANLDALKLGGGRWRRAGRKVQVVRPTAGKDLNDVFLLKNEISA